MDNREPTCPALMSDRRIFRNYFDNDVFNQTVRTMNKIGDNHEYRVFLQKNAEEIINREREFTMKRNTCDVHGKCSWQK